MSKLTKRSCLHCSSLFIPHRNPKQQYCDHQSCQNVRKQKWRQNKLRGDSDYKQNRNNASKRWRAKNSHYWARYRKEQHDYVHQNRLKQQNRNLKRHCLVIANSDALPTQSLIKPGTYKLTPYDKVIANSDALIVNISIISDSYNAGAIIM